MSYFSPNAHDAKLNYIKNNTENLYICSSEPTTFLEASSTYKLGVKAAPSFTGPAAGDTSGRKITVNAVTDGSITGTGWVYYIALTDDSASELLHVKVVNVAREITTELVFTLAAFDIESLDPA